MKLLILMLLVIPSITISAWDDGFVKLFNPPLDEGLSKNVAVVTEKKEETIQEKIIRYSELRGVNKNLALAIAGCESGFRNVKNAGTATGPFQQLQRFWNGRAAKYGYKGYSVWNIDANIDVSIQMIKNEGTSHWNESKYCWNK